jgi:integrase
MSPRPRRSGPRLWENGYYYIDEVIGFGESARRFRQSLGTKDPKYAHRLWERERARQWSIFYGEDVKAPTTPARFGDLIEPFVAHERDVRKAKTWKTFEQRLGRVRDAWKNPLLAEVSPASVRALEDHLSSLPRARSKATVNHYVGLVKTFFNWAIERGYFAGTNPMRSVKPHVVAQKRRGYTDAELSRILGAAGRISAESKNNASCNAARYAEEIVQLLALTGMRLGEVLELRWQNVQGGVLSISRTETKQQRDKVIPITARVGATIENLRGRDPEYVLPLDRAHKRIEVRELMHRIREMAQIPDFCFHGLRHTAAEIMVSEALGRGAGLRDVMAVLGHSRIETTLRYDHSALARMRLAAQALEDRIKP